MFGGTCQDTLWELQGPQIVDSAHSVVRFQNRPGIDLAHFGTQFRGSVQKGEKGPHVLLNWEEHFLSKHVLNFSDLQLAGFL